MPNFPLDCCGETIPSLDHDLHEIVCQVIDRQIQMVDGMGKGIIFIGGYNVGHTITGVCHNTSGMTRVIQGQHSLGSNIDGWDVEGLKYNLCYLFSVLDLGLRRASVSSTGFFSGATQSML